MTKKMTFALAFCNRGFMPGELIYGAREDMIKAVTDAGYDYIAMDASLTRFGGIETRDEGLLYAKWLFGVKCNTKRTADIKGLTQTSQPFCIRIMFF